MRSASCVVGSALSVWYHPGWCDDTFVMLIAHLVGRCSVALNIGPFQLPRVVGDFPIARLLRSILGTAGYFRARCEGAAECWDGCRLMTFSAGVRLLSSTCKKRSRNEPWDLPSDT